MSHPDQPLCHCDELTVTQDYKAVQVYAVCVYGDNMSSLPGACYRFYFTLGHLLVFVRTQIKYEFIKYDAYLYIGLGRNSSLKNCHKLLTLMSFNCSSIFCVMFTVLFNTQQKVCDDLYAEKVP